MSTISKRISKTGEISYQVKVRVKGYPPVNGTFERKTDAKHWGEKTEAEMRDNKYFPSNNARKHAVSDLIDLYVDDLKVKNSRRYEEIKMMLEGGKVS